MGDQAKNPKSVEQSLTPQPSHAQGDVKSLDIVDGSDAANLLAVEEAMHAIGMGRYQWQLTASAGFGFLVDQVSWRRPKTQVPSW